VSPTTRRIEDLDSRTLESLVTPRRVLILPVGALEAHGPHLPLGADLLQAQATALALAERLDGLVAPGLPYGVCPGTREFPGTVSHSLETLSLVSEELLEDFYRFGFRRILILSGHGHPHHMAALREGAERVLRRYSDLHVAALCDYELVYELRGREAPPMDGHGGLLETSRVLALAPDLVRTPQVALIPGVARFRVNPPDRQEWAESFMGDPRSATPELGRRVQNYVLDRLMELIPAALRLD
jgi:creatinine amidohydrolase